MEEETPKSPKNPDNPSPPTYRSKCLTCGHHHPKDLDAHRYPFEHVTLEDVELWRAAGDSEQAIMSRIAARGMVE